ncbi:MAG: peroxiredoxin-like family protein [Elainellaceae cyanobacterium]
MSLNQQIAELRAENQAKIPAESRAVMAQATEDLSTSGILDQVRREGDRLPAITLPNALGQPVCVQDLLARGPVVISFYRGEWCPYCNLELRALQQALPDIQAQGATLVAISPQTPDHSLSAAEKHELAFEVLSDVGNQVAREFGLVFKLSPKLLPIYEKFGIDIAAHNGDESYELPIPATYVVDRNGTIVHAFVDADYTQRLEPAEIVEALTQIRAVA